MFVTTRALVLREVKYKDADKILTVLTADRGKLTVKAASAMRKTSKYCAASQSFVFSEMTLFEKDGRYSLREASCIEEFAPLRQDLRSLALASFFASVLEAVSDEDMAQSALLQLGLNSLFAICHDLRERRQIKAAFEIRVMCLSGFEPDVSCCCVCGREDPERPMFSVSGGVMHCLECGPTQAGRSLPLCDGSLLAMRHIISANAKNIFAFSIGGQAMERLSAIAEEYLLLHLDRSFRSLDYYKALGIVEK